MTVQTETERQDGIPATGDETERRPMGKGVVLLVVAIKKNGAPGPIPFLWTTIEKTSKPETEKIAGQISFPAETRKQGESPEDTLLGAIAEFTNDDALIGRLSTPRVGNYMPSAILVGGNLIDLAIVFHEGLLDEEITPADSAEISTNGWRSLDQLRSEDPNKLRSIITKTLVVEETSGFIRQAVEAYQAGDRVNLLTLIPKLSSEDFSIIRFHRQREKGKDVDLKQGDRSPRPGAQTIEDLRAS